MGLAEIQAAVILAKSVVMAVLVKNGQQVLERTMLAVAVGVTKAMRQIGAMVELAAVATALPQSIMAHLLPPPQRVRRTRAVVAVVLAVVAIQHQRLADPALLLLDIRLIHHLQVLQYLRVLLSRHQ